MGFGGWLKDMAFDTAVTSAITPYTGPLAPIIGPELSDSLQKGTSGAALAPIKPLVDAGMNVANATSSPSSMAHTMLQPLQFPGIGGGDGPNKDGLLYGKNNSAVGNM